MSDTILETTLYNHINNELSMIHAEQTVTTQNNCENNCEDDGFTTVKIKKRSNKEKKTQNIVTQDLITKNEKVTEIFEKYKPMSVMLYGSYARNTYNSGSNINIIIIWNYKQKLIIETSTEKIKNELFQLFNKKIEIMSMILKKNDYNNNSNYITNIYADSHVIYGDKLKDNIFNSMIFTDYKTKY
jgi:predicted nucleotidyltransferase